MKQILFVFVLLILSSTRSAAQQPNLSEQIATTAMNSLWRDSSRNENGEPSRWSYEQGVVLKGIEGLWLSIGDGRYFTFIQKGMDNFVNADGTIRTYKAEDYNLDNINSGKILLLLYKITGQDRYRKAAALLREQLKN